MNADQLKTAADALGKCVSEMSLPHIQYAMNACIMLRAAAEEIVYLNKQLDRNFDDLKKANSCLEELVADKAADEAAFTDALRDLHQFWKGTHEQQQM